MNNILKSLVIGCLALLITVSLPAEDTRVSSYPGIIDDQLNKITDDNPKGVRSEMSRREQEEEQQKWDRLSDSEKRGIEDKRTKKRDEGISYINKRLEELDRENEKLAQKRDRGADQRKLDRKQQIVDEKRAKLMLLRTRLERAPAGQNVDLEAMPKVGEETGGNPSRH